MPTVTKKPKPHPTALNLSKCLSSTTRAAYPGDEFNSSEVISRIIAVTASHKLISEIDKGKIMRSPDKFKLSDNAAVAR
jgi:hypothetical protein